MASHPPAVVRVLGVGLALGLLAAAIAFGVFALLKIHVDCSALTSAECALETDIAHGVARLEAFGAVGCALVAAGLGLALRR